MKGQRIINRTSYLLTNGPRILQAYLKVLCVPELRRALGLLNEDIERDSQTEPSQQDCLLAKRLIQNYQSQAQAYQSLIKRKKGLVYKLSPQWRRQIEERRQEYVNCLRNGDEVGLSRMLASFFRNAGSEGITEPTDYGRRATVANSKLVLLVNDWVKKLSKLERESRVSCTKLYNTPITGNPYLAHLDGAALHSGSLYYLAHVYHILKYTDLDVNGQYLFVDLGAGYGGILKFLLQLFPRSKAIVFDIPEILIFSSFYLTKAFPDKNLGYFLDRSNLTDGLPAKDILFLPHWQLKELPEGSVDLFINTGSLPEMPWEAGVHYLQIIKQAVKPGGYFYTYNRWRTITVEAHPLEHGLKELLEAASMEDHFDTIAQGEFVLYPNNVSRQVVLRKRWTQNISWDGPTARFSAHPLGGAD